MKFLYVSTLCSNCELDKILKTSKIKPLQSIQKFHRLICEGFVLNNVNVSTMTTIPVSPYTHKKKIWNEKNEFYKGIEYIYLPFLNLPIIKQISTIISSILNIVKFKFGCKDDKVIICDILNATISITTLLFSKFFNIKCITIVTDLPSDIGKNNFKGKLYKTLLKKMQSKFDGYIFLTEEMNEVINTNKRPYMIMEGLVDYSMESVENRLEDKYKKKIIIYAGGLYEKYGIKMLVEAFQSIKDKNIELWLYGSGDLDEYIKNINDNRVKFYGVVNNSLVVKEEIKATLLINPRFTNDDYTKYSFPSKNMEYMVSGTPVLTTKLAGMPKEYYDYVYFIEYETVSGISNIIKDIINKDEKVLYNKGQNAKKFVLENKNNIVQSKNIIDFIRKFIIKEEI